MISVWLDGYPDDFNAPLTHPCLQKLIEFAEQHIEGGDLAHRAKHRLHKFIANDESSVRGIEGVLNLQVLIYTWKKTKIEQ